MYTIMIKYGGDDDDSNMLDNGLLQDEGHVNDAVDADNICHVAGPTSSRVKG